MIECVCGARNDHNGNPLRLDPKNLDEVLELCANMECFVDATDWRFVDMIQEKICTEGGSIHTQPNATGHCEYCGKQMVTPQEERESQPIQFDDNLGLRQLLWLTHGNRATGCGVGALYGDDGAMDCSRCMIDFRNDSVPDIGSALRKKALEAFKEHATPKEGGKSFMLFQARGAVPMNDAEGRPMPIADTQRVPPAVAGNRADCYYCGYGCPIVAGSHDCRYHGKRACKNNRPDVTMITFAQAQGGRSKPHALLRIQTGPKVREFLIGEGDSVLLPRPTITIAE